MHIVVHKGQAHRDELLACALIIAKNEQSIDCILRRDPTPAEHLHPAVWVVDVGMEHNPSLLNFDHHQMEPDCGECAFTLVAKYMHVHEELEAAFGWYRLSAIMDTQGPGGVAKSLGTDYGTVVRLWSSPVEHVVLELFQEYDEIDRENAPVLWGLVKSMGDGILEYVAKFRKRMSYLEDRVETVSGAGLPGMFLARDPNTPPSPFGLDACRKKRHSSAAFSITPDDRGEGYALYRYEDHPGLDFFKLADDPRILFAHKGGFIAKTLKPLPMKELLELVHDAAVLVKK